MREKTINALVEMGASLDTAKSREAMNGFTYIVFIMQLYEENGCYFSNMRACFEIVAKRNGTNWENVMVCVNKAINTLLHHGNGSAVVKYLGFMPKTSGNFLAMMYQRLKEEE